LLALRPLTARVRQRSESEDSVDWVEQADRLWAAELGVSSPFFLLAALISAGAAVLSLFLVFAALAGISSQLVFDRSASTVTYSFDAPVVRRTSRVYPLSAVGSGEVEERTWTEGAPTYHLRVAIDDGAVIESGSSSSRDEVEAIRARIERFTTGDRA